MTKQIKSRGFTIIELLIVIVIIAILAAITIVAYNGIQNRANNSGAQSAANNMVKKIEAYNAINQTYPTATTVTAYKTALEADDTTKISNAGIDIAATPDRTNGKNTVQISNCAGKGAIINYYDFTLGALTSATANPSNNVSLKVGDTSGTCTLLT